VTLRAGAAVADISPAHPMPLFGYPHVERLSTGIHDPILSSALYLSNGPEALVLIALDVLLIDPPTARSIRCAVARQLSLREECVLISCTHTHSAPVTGGLLAWRWDAAVPPPDLDYLHRVKERAVESAIQAAKKAEPAELAWTRAQVIGVGGNRLDPSGVTDPEAGILAVRAVGGGPLLALAAIYGMHPTVLHEDSTLVSSDFPHYTREELKERFNAGLTVVYHNGACGNQSPRFFTRGQTFAEAERLGRALGGAIGGAVEKLAKESFRAHVPLRALLRAVELPRRQLPSVRAAEQQFQQCRSDYQRLKVARGESAALRTAECAVFGAEGARVLARLEEAGEIEKTLAAWRPVTVQALRIGEACVTGWPGEVFTEYSLELKHRSSGCAHVVTLVNGQLQGYIVTPEACSRGGYEALAAVFSPAAGAILVETTLDLIRALVATPPLKGEANGVVDSCH